MPTMRGFSAAISRSTAAADHLQAGSIAVGLESDGAWPVVAIALTHADGTLLTAHLGEAALDRLAHLLADAVRGLPTGPVPVTILPRVR